MNSIEWTEASLPYIIRRTRDVNESVRQKVYTALGTKTELSAFRFVKSNLSEVVMTEWCKPIKVFVSCPYADGHLYKIYSASFYFYSFQ